MEGDIDQGDTQFRRQGAGAPDQPVEQACKLAVGFFRVPGCQAMQPINEAFAECMDCLGTEVLSLKCAASVRCRRPIPAAWLSA